MNYLLGEQKMSDIEQNEPEYATDEILDWRKDVSLALIQSMDSGSITELIKSLEPAVFNPHKHTGK